VERSAAPASRSKHFRAQQILARLELPPAERAVDAKNKTPDRAGAETGEGGFLFRVALLGFVLGFVFLGSLVMFVVVVMVRRGGGAVSFVGGLARLVRRLIGRFVVLGKGERRQRDGESYGE